MLAANVQAPGGQPLLPPTWVVRLGGVGARPSVTGLVSDSDGAVVALAAAAMRNTDPVTKVTILPRGRALGYTMVVPLDDKYSVTRNELLDQLTYAMGGRVAEEIVFQDPTTGASNDIEKATSIARRMVTESSTTMIVRRPSVMRPSGRLPASASRAG
mgnify:CR=1 FL=1